MRASVVDKTLAVVLVLQRGNDPRRFGLLAFCLVLRLLPSSDTRDKGETRTVRRPHRVGRAIAELSEPCWLAAIGWHDIQLRFLLRHPLGDEGQPRAIWRSARCCIALRASGETARFATCRVHHPDVGQISSWSSESVVTTKATRRPSGESCGSLINRIRVISCGVMARRLGTIIARLHQSTAMWQSAEMMLQSRRFLPAHIRTCCRPFSLRCDVCHPSMLAR